MALILSTFNTQLIEVNKIFCIQPPSTYTSENWGDFCPMFALWKFADI